MIRVSAKLLTLINVETNFKVIQVKFLIFNHSHNYSWVKSCPLNFKSQTNHLIFVFFTLQLITTLRKTRRPKSWAAAATCYRERRRWLKCGFGHFTLGTRRHGHTFLGIIGNRTRLWIPSDRSVPRCWVQKFKVIVMHMKVCIKEG